MSELEVAESMRLNGLPWSVHLMVSSGERTRFGLASPSLRRLKRGDPVTVAFGIAGALNCRAGFLATDESELPGGIRDYVPRLVQPYFEAIARWYEAVGIGVTGGEMYAAVATLRRKSVLRRRPQSRPSPASRRMGALADLQGQQDPALLPEWRSRST